MLSPKLNAAIIKATDKPDFQDALRRKYYIKELLKDAEKTLSDCYEDLRDVKTNLVAGIDLNLLRLNIETHIEFLNRESLRSDQAIDRWMSYVNVETRKATNKLEIDYQNGEF
jgi:hypothetical protein